MKNWKPDFDQVYENGSIDDHFNFNVDNFLDYFQDCVLVHLREPSTIILDIARYHTTVSDDVFNPYKARKEKLRIWLKQNKVKFDKKALKEELKMLALCHWIPPLTIIEEMAEEHGLQYFGVPHRVVFIPPYHPEYNGNDLAWGQVKRFVGNNPTYKIKKLIDETLPKALSNFTQEKAKAIYSHIIKKIKDDFQNETDQDEIDFRIRDSYNKF